MRISNYVIVFLFLLMNSSRIAAQYTPIPLTGFTADVVAEAGPGSLATTTTYLDALASNKVMYSEAFRVFAGIGGGGLPDNGTIVSGGMTFQLAPYTGNNALVVSRSTNASLDLVTPASFARLRLLCFATEANTLSPAGALVNVSLSFTDGTTVPYVTGAVLTDWFNGTTNTVLNGFGRCSRVATAPWGDDGYPANPRMYYIELTLSCTDIPKLIQRINVSNVTTSGNNAPFPNVVVMGVSGIAYARTITPVIIPSDCNGPNGSIALTVTGSSAPYSFVWNTTPVQNGATASGLAPGNYSCTVTDANGCTSTYSGTVPLINNAVITATALPAALCAGSSSTLTGMATTGSLSTWTWTPGNLTGASVSVSPGSTTTYTLSARNALGCTATAQVTLTVNPLPAIPVVPDVAVCPGNNGVLSVQNPLPGITYNWYTAATGGTLLASGSTYTVNNVTVNTIYYVEAVSGAGCSSPARAAVNVTLNPVPAPPVVNSLIVCAGTNVTLQIQSPQTGYLYNWYGVATGGTPSGTGTSFVINSITTATTVYAEAVNSTGCVSATRQPVTVNLLAPLPVPVVAVTNTTFTSLTFSWNAVAGATAYELTTNGGNSYSTVTGTSYTINGLTGNQTITLQVRALGGQACETSLLSAAISGTTLSTKEIFVPNVFTPNGDGRNDVLYVYGNYVSSIHFNVYNQWGQLIFTSTALSGGWDGRYRGQQQPVGVYAYTLKVVLQDGTVKTKKGAVNLIR